MLQDQESVQPPSQVLKNIYNYILELESRTQEVKTLKKSNQYLTGQIAQMEADNIELRQKLTDLKKKISVLKELITND